MLKGLGLGLRREFMHQVADDLVALVDYYELAPENWIGVGGRRRKILEKIRLNTPLIAHGLSLSIGSLAPLDLDFLKDLKKFLDDFEIEFYSEHLSYSSDDGHLYDLMPLPFSEEAVFHVSDRIKQVQDILDRNIALENISYYADINCGMNELDFIRAVLDEADCMMLLDVNNIYVNSVNHRYDAMQFLASLPSERLAYMHIAGHEQQMDKIIDTHGSPISEPVFELLRHAYRIHGDRLVLLERDNHVPGINDLVEELRHLNHIRHECFSDDNQ